MTLAEVVRAGALSPAEARAVELLRAIKNDAAGRGHGTLRVEVTDGRETLFKREHSEKPTR